LWFASLLDIMFNPFRKTEVRRLVSKKLKTQAFVSLRKKLVRKAFTIHEKGVVISVKDGVAQVYGLKSVKAGELVRFGRTNIFGMALNLERETVGVVVFAEDYLIKQGSSVYRTGELVAIQVSDNMLGRTVDALGRPIDGLGQIL